MGRWMCELIFFVIARLEGDEDAEVVLARCDADGCAGEFGGELVKAACCDALGWARNDKGGNGRMMGSLLGNVGNGVRIGG